MSELPILETEAEMRLMLVARGMTHAYRELAARAQVGEDKICTIENIASKTISLPKKLATSFPS